MLRDAKGGEAENPEEEGLLSVPPEAFSGLPVRHPGSPRATPERTARV